MAAVAGNPVARRRSVSVRRTISFDPFVERMIRRHEAEMLNAGWRNANFSLSTNMIVLACFFDHACEGESLHVETIKRINRYIKGTLELGEKDFQRWSRWIAKVGQQREAQEKSYR